MAVSFDDFCMKKTFCDFFASPNLEVVIRLSYLTEHILLFKMFPVVGHTIDHGSLKSIHSIALLVLKDPTPLQISKEILIPLAPKLIAGTTKYK